MRPNGFAVSVCKRVKTGLPNVTEGTKISFIAKAAKCPCCVFWPSPEWCPCALPPRILQGGPAPHARAPQAVTYIPRPAPRAFVLKKFKDPMMAPGGPAPPPKWMPAPRNIEAAGAPHQPPGEKSRGLSKGPRAPQHREWGLAIKLASGWTDRFEQFLTNGEGNRGNFD